MARSCSVRTPTSLFVDSVERFGSGSFAFTRVGERVLGELLDL